MIEAGRPRPAPGLRARRGGDPLLRDRRLRRRLRGAGGERRTAGTVVVDVPGGRLSVQIDAGTTVLTGPAVIVSAGALCGEWLAG